MTHFHPCDLASCGVPGWPVVEIGSPAVGFEATAAAGLAHLIDSRLPDVWERLGDGPGMWRWERTDDEGGRWIVAVNAREDRILVPCHGWPERVGPTVLAARWGDPFATVTLPWMSDSADCAKALRVLAQVIPDLAKEDRT